MPKGIEALLKQSIEENPIADIVGSLSSDKDLERNSDLDNPVLLACLTTEQKYLEDNNLNESAQFLKNFTYNLLSYLISKKRMSRNEKVESLKAIAMIQKNTDDSNKSITKMGVLP